MDFPYIILLLLLLLLAIRNGNILNILITYLYACWIVFIFVRFVRLLSVLILGLLSVKLEIHFISR